ncbi:MAG TPA: hypothetical protein PKC32_04610 [Sphingopyxis sp.]|nr:hypothetical protein [Sphingopyxis sp.]
MTDPIGMVPALTPAIEAALPERFTRDASGNLTAIDLRPLNFARSEQRNLNWGLFLSLPLGRAATGQNVSESDAEENDSGERRPLFRSSGLLVASLSHSWQIENRLVLAQGVPPIDLASGASFGDRPTVRHRVDARINLNKAGLGLAVDGRWQSAATLDAGGSALHFGALATMNAKVFADLGRMMSDRRWAKGARVSFGVENLLDARGRVRVCAAAGVASATTQVLAARAAKIPR